MGLDFITRCTPSFQRSWDAGRADLLEPDLFRRHPQLEGRTFRLAPADGRTLRAGEDVLLRWHDDRLVAYCGHDPVGTVAAPPAVLTEAVQQAGGVLCARVHHVHPRSGAGDITLTP